MTAFEQHIPFRQTIRQRLRTLPHALIPRRRHLRALLALLLLLPVVLWQTKVWTERVVINQIRENARDTLNIYTFQIRSELDKFKFMPEILSKNSAIIQLLANPRDPDQLLRVNRYLEKITGITNASDIYVMDKTGLTVAASNWNGPISFVGKNFDYRPYFQAAMQGEIGRYFALGVTSNKRGYYFAAPVQIDEQIFGVTVVKVGMERLESLGTWGTDRVVIADDLGVIFASSHPAWKFKTIRPLDPSALKALQDSLRYSDATLSPLPVTSERPIAKDQRIIAVQEQPQQDSGHSQDYLVQSALMPELDWQVHVFSPMKPVYRAVSLALIFAVFVFIIAFLGTLYLAQRRLNIKQRLATQEALQKAHDQLETKVVERTAELHQSNQRLQQEIVERQHTENELIQAAKLAALGQMSAGIAHELNQPLAAIRSYSDNARIFLEREHYDQVGTNLLTLSQLTERMAKITSHLKTFARKTPGKVEAVALQPVIVNAISLMAAAARREGVELFQELSEIQVWGDAIRLEQVLVNLLKNALEAMRDQDQPKQIHITLAALPEHAMLTVRDSGPGIPEEQLSQVFDPFFTTKEIGEGLGLGLSISYKIIREFGGSIRVGNHEAGGVVFTVTLSRADTEENVA